MSKVKLNLHRIDSREELEKAALAEQSLTAAELWLYNSNTQCFDTTMKNSTMKKLHFNSFNGTTKNSTIKKKTVHYLVAPLQFYVEAWIFMTLVL